MSAPSISIPYGQARPTTDQRTTIASDRPMAQGSFAAGLVASAPHLPLLAALGTVVTYLAPKDVTLLGNWPKAGIAGHALLAGALIGFMAWVALAILYWCWGCTGAAGANAHSHGQLYERLQGLRTWCAVLEPYAAAATPPSDAPAIPNQAATSAGLARGAAAVTEVRCYKDAIEHELSSQPPGLRWLQATGYVTLWNLVHRAEEALIEAEPASSVLGDAFYDELRLNDSPIGNSNVLRAQLRQAVAVLQPGSRQYLQPPSGQPAGAVATPDQAPLDGSSAASVTLDPGADAAARAILRGIRRAINEFRDARRDGLVHARNCLLMTTFLTGLFSYLLLGLAVCNVAPSSAITVAATFFLVGALVGLFNRLYVDSRADAATEDYGLSRARLMQTPVLSGLAAIGGVLITAMVAGTPSAAPHQLATIYGFSTNSSDLLIAALFGLTPHLLISRLSNQAEQFKSDLKGTAAASSPLLTHAA